MDRASDSGSESRGFKSLRAHKKQAIDHSPTIGYKPVSTFWSKVLQVITEDVFETSLKDKLGSDWDTALELFRSYRPQLSLAFTSALLYATEQDKITEVLDKLKEHFEKRLNYQHPDIRGTIAIMGTNPTEVFFEELFSKTLGLQPQT